jgi:transposase
LADLLGVPAAQVHTDRLYAGLDAVLPQKAGIEGHLRSRLGELFEIKYDLLLYDVTSTYFEGDAGGNPMARRGYSRDHRPDRPQVCIALVVNSEGMPLGYEVFDGNTQDSTTVQTIVAAMEQRHGQSRRVWVMDRGMVSEANLKWMREQGRQYIVGTPKAMLRGFEQHLVGKDWQEVREGVQVKLVPGADGQDTFILARSADRRNKERAMHAKFATAIERQLEKLQKSVASGRLQDLGELNRKLGRLHERYWRAWGAFEIEARQVEPSGDGQPARTAKARLMLTWQRNARFEQWGDLAQGCYLLRTNLNETDPAVLWKHYMQLTEAEWAFRITKDELSIRPIWHHGSERTKAHILVCFLAYVMWKTLGGWMSRSGLGHAPRTLLEEMQKIKCADVTLPVREVGQTQERLLTLRCVTTPDEAQQVLLHRLGLTLPRRLQYTEELAVESVPASTAATKM